MSSAFFASLSSIMSSSFIRAGLILSILNTVAILYTQASLDSLGLYTILRLGCLEICFTMALALALLCLSQWTQSLAQDIFFRSTLNPPARDFSSYKYSISKHIVWVYLAIINAFYMGPDWGGAAYKFSIFLNIEFLQNGIHFLIILSLCSSHVLIIWTLSRLKLSLHKMFLMSVVIVIYLLNESILEGAYFGIHFFLGTMTFQALVLLFESNPASIPFASTEVQNLDSANTYHLTDKTKQRLYRLTNLIMPLLILSSFISASSILSSHQDLRQKYNHSESASALKFWTFFFTQNHTRYQQDKLNIPIESHWINGHRLANLQKAWRSDLRASLAVAPSIRNSHQIQNQTRTTTAQTSTKPIVILLTIDSLKADWFSQRSIPPELKHLKALSQDRSTWFSSKIFSASTSTRFTLGSLIYGRYPSHLRWNKDRATHPSLTKDRHKNLWTRLAEHQVKTIYLASDPTIIRQSNGLGKGLSQIIRFPPRPKFRVTFSPQIFDRLITELQKAMQTTGSTLLFSHLLDAHHPFNGGQKVYKNKIKSHLAELAIIDHQIARLLKLIRQSSARDRIWLIISSDHGQGFGRHHVRTHNAAPYEHQARVPIWIYKAGFADQETQSQLHKTIKKAWSNSQSWSSIDLHTTLLELFSAPINADSQGISWWPYLSLIGHHLPSKKHLLSDWLSKESEALSRRPILSLNWYSRALYRPGEHIKFIEETRTQTLMLFDLKTDPLELNNLCTAQDSKCRAERESLNRLVYTQGRQPIEFNKKLR